MIHALRIKGGNATYVSRYVKTSRLIQEEYFEGSKFCKVFFCIILSDSTLRQYLHSIVVWRLINHHEKNKSIHSNICNLLTRDSLQ